MKKILGLLVLTASIFAFAVFFTSCVTVGVAVSGGKSVEATTVHHIFPLEDYPEYALCDWNLISLSTKQHDTLHDRTTGRLTAKGMELLRRTARARGIPPP